MNQGWVGDEEKVPDSPVESLGCEGQIVVLAGSLAGHHHRDVTMALLPVGWQRVPAVDQMPSSWKE